jgi:tRNA pseudouridine65 synthase
VAVDFTVDFVHRDDALAVVDKPSGIVVHPGWAQDEGGLLRWVRQALGRPVFPVHRLDRGASGLVIFALTAEAAAVMGKAFAEGRVSKRYLALVRGQPPAAAWIDHPIPNKEGGPRVPAVTFVRTLGQWQRYALCEARPLTGRLHQIRRHLKHIACPLIGDVNYGKGEHNRFFRSEFGLDRLALHALSLGFAHPMTAAPLRLTAPVSGSFAACLRAIGLEAAASVAAEQAAALGGLEPDAGGELEQRRVGAGGHEERGGGEDALPGGAIAGFGPFEEE